MNGQMMIELLGIIIVIGVASAFAICKAFRNE